LNLFLASTFIIQRRLAAEVNDCFEKLEVAAAFTVQNREYGKAVRSFMKIFRRPMVKIILFK
jgi:hypothetical protein